MESIGGQLLIQVLLILFNALFACIEIAVISFNDTKLERLSTLGDKKAKKLFTLVNQPAKFFATTQIGITIAGFLASAFAAGDFSVYLVAFIQKLDLGLPDHFIQTVSVIIITLFLSFFMLIFGELIPKRLATKNPESIALFMANFIFVIAKIFAPIVWLLTNTTNGILFLIGISPQDEVDNVTEEEIRMMVDVGTEKGTIDQDEKDFINNIFEFDNKIASDVMTHRTEVQMLWLEESDEEWFNTICKTNYSYYPICNDTFDNIVGILNTKVYFRIEDKSRENVLKNATITPEFISESVKMDVLFNHMKTNRHYFAVVVDEYGGMSGVITVHDLIEELVGDLDDSDDIDNQQLIKKIDDNLWEISGYAELEDISKELKIILPEEEYGIFGGLVFGELGIIPNDGTKTELEAYGLKIIVEEVKDHRLIKAIVSVIKDEQKEESED